jgi:hypothetical protein
LLREVEVVFKDEVTGKLSRFDLLISDPESNVTDDGEKIKILVEVKNWTGFMVLEEKDKRTRLASLLRQLKKYKAAGMPVQLDWKGPIPTRVRNAVEELDVKINEIL